MVPVTRPTHNFLRHHGPTQNFFHAIFYKKHQLHDLTRYLTPNFKESLKTLGLQVMRIGRGEILTFDVELVEISHPYSIYALW